MTMEPATATLKLLERLASKQITCLQAPFNIALTPQSSDPSM